ncbi:Uncharacterised protein [Delftia tsuruhatensis]|uniref:carboxypeptidase regulatory-like domain-containing protein n=1 Tax=Delftia tsuruhatensis TaxID=180282 RepID=UPI001E7B6635|nr:carboxypeptidase regulatory-like domain-containing protein [Delftia tsuruhatensis]CAB5669302.1 Uncharacterised protein [Delftia tsuruhatensis]CAC9682774.1 Uncharacterised protein [Delftia tsuruhatensis]
MTQLNAVIQLIDGFSRQPAESAGASFRLDGRVVLPLAKPQAFHAFVGLESGSYGLQVSCPGFFPQEMRLQVQPTGLLQSSLADAVVACILLPDALYPYPGHTTLLRGQVLAALDRQALPGIEVRAAYQDARGRTRTRQTFTNAHGHGGGRQRSPYLGRYALPLPGRLADETTVALCFSRAGQPPVQRRVTIGPGTTLLQDVEL